MVNRFPVEEGHVLMFARSIGDFSARYAKDTDTNDEIYAPPTFTESAKHFDPEFYLRPQEGEPWFGSGAGPGTVRAATGEIPGLHAEQHFEYHRPIRVGDVLSASTHRGATWEKQGRSGLLRFFEDITEYRDNVGELVLTARSIIVRRSGGGPK